MPRNNTENKSLIPHDDANATPPSGNPVHIPISRAALTHRLQEIIYGTPDPQPGNVEQVYLDDPLEYTADCQYTGHAGVADEPPASIERRFRILYAAAQLVAPDLADQMGWVPIAISEKGYAVANEAMTLLEDEFLTGIQEEKS
jgi:hypothetical protein